MLTEKTMEKLRVLAESAKYDVSCSSSGTVRKGKQGMVGSTVGGVAPSQSWRRSRWSSIAGTISKDCFFRVVW